MIPAIKLLDIYNYIKEIQINYLFFIKFNKNNL